MATSLRDPVQSELASVIETARMRTGGTVASYIPELATADPEALGVALVSTRGAVHQAGDSEVPFTIQSVSKPFVFALALELLGLEKVLQHVGLEPSGEPFNAISLEPETGRPRNPMINAGAVVVSSLIPGESADEKFAGIHAGLNAFAARELDVNEAVFASEELTGDRNRALAYLALSTGVLASPARVATEAYFRQCAVEVTARDIAIMSATLAAGGRNPVSGERVVSAEVARTTMAVMSSCGMYDASGDWLVRVGLPAKSGVGGGIVAVLPDEFGIGTFSPPLDDQGNSVRGIAILEELSTRGGLHMLAQRGQAHSPISSIARDGEAIVAVLRGEIGFAGAEEILTRLAPIVGPTGTAVFDFSAVTLIEPAGRM
ncbi:MAG: glutaminase A, partial [Leifsonia sp.]